MIAIISFWGGMKYGQNKSSNVPSFGNRQNSFGQNGPNNSQNNVTKMMGQNTRGSMGGGIISGEILSKDDTSITIKLRDGGSKIVFMSPSSKVEKTIDGAVSDVVVGKSVMITGTTNVDGSITATSIQMRPTQTEPVKTN